MTIYLEPWQIYLAGIFTGIIITVIMIIIFAVRHARVVRVEEAKDGVREESKDINNQSN